MTGIENDIEMEDQKMEEKAELSFEEAASRIDEIVRMLERGDAPLDKSLALFEEGAKLIKSCGKILDDAEQKLVFLQRSADGEPEELPFDEDE